MSAQLQKSASAWKDLQLQKLLGSKDLQLQTLLGSRILAKSNLDV
jgi:hypothetical protein